MKKLMAANWKMYKTRAQAASYARDLVGLVGDRLPDDREILIIPPFTAITAVAEILASTPGYSVGAQNFYPAEEGAFTGEISPSMLNDLGCAYALTGHSERRHVMGEADEFVAEKTKFGLNSGLKIILCIGETIEQRKAGKVREVLERQLGIGLGGIAKSTSPDVLAIAYEPVWAIGTGEVAGPEQILEAHADVRKILSGIMDKGDRMRILYGGSVKPGNCAEIINLDNVDGVLVGGASLQAESFSQIILAGI